MITEEKQVKTYRLGLAALLIHVTGVLFGMWSGEYTLWICWAVILIMIGSLIYLIWRGWKK